MAMLNNQMVNFGGFIGHVWADVRIEALICITIKWGEWMMMKFGTPPCQESWGLLVLG
jgi:hypothetical protein